MKPDGVSIIICGYNATARIRPTLRALHQQQFLEQKITWEVIVVDNASTDNTSVVAAEVWKENPVTEFRIVSEEKPGLMHARHKGLAVSKYEIVSFVDDDNWVEPGWIEKIFSIFSTDKNIGACGGSSEAVFESIKPDWFSSYENSFAVGRQADETGYIENKKGFLWGAGLSFRKSLWQDLQNRGFKNLTIGREGKSITAGDDTELCYAIRLLGYHLYYRDDLTLKHFMPAGRMNFSYLEKMNIGFGKANARLNCYRVLLYPSAFKLKPWYYEWLAAMKKIVILSIKTIVSVDKKKKWAAKVLRAYWKGYAVQTWNDKTQVQKNISTLRTCFSS